MRFARSGKGSERAQLHRFRNLRGCQDIPFLLPGRQECRMIKKAIAKIVENIDLSEGEMIEVMNQVMSGEATPAQIGSFITALRIKGETVDEITGAARVMRERATRIRVG